jgi:hypothetical protein
VGGLADGPGAYVCSRGWGCQPKQHVMATYYRGVAGSFGSVDLLFVVIGCGS